MFGLDVRVVIRVHGLVFTLLVGTRREGHWEMESKRLDPIKTGSTGKLTGQGRHLCWILEIIE